MSAANAKDASIQDYLDRLDAATRRIEQRREASKMKKKATEDRMPGLRVSRTTNSRDSAQNKELSKTQSGGQEVTGTTDIKDSSTSSQKKTVGDFLRETDGVDEKFDVVGKAELDDEFDVVRGQGPSAVNGKVPANTVLDAAEAAFQPIVHGERHSYDDGKAEGDEWGTGSLEVRKWVGEKTANVGGDGKVKGTKAVRFNSEA